MWGLVWSYYYIEREFILSERWATFEIGDVGIDHENSVEEEELVEEGRGLLDLSVVLVVVLMIWHWTHWSFGFNHRTKISR